jgi:hypothetical protein
MEDAVAAFVMANSKTPEVRACVVDKDFEERTLLRKYFPAARFSCAIITLSRYSPRRYQVNVRLIWESFGMSHMNCKCQAKELVSATKTEKDLHHRHHAIYGVCEVQMGI